MKRLVAIIVLLALVACSSSVETKEPTVVGNWVFVNQAGTAGTGITFRGDGSYTFLNMRLTSDKSANAEVETGIYTDNGSAIVFTPQQYTCPGPDPIVTFPRSFSNGNLVFSLPSGVISLQPNNAPPAESFVVVYGCFDNKTGAFTRAELSPVDN